MLLKIRKDGFGWKGRVVRFQSIYNNILGLGGKRDGLGREVFSVCRTASLHWVWVIRELIYSHKLCFWDDHVFDWDVILASAGTIPLRQGLAFNPAHKQW